MQNIIYSAPAKVHLLGEHSVVYGKPAIIAALNLRCRVELIPLKTRNIDIVWEDLGKNDLSFHKAAIKEVFKYYKTRPKKGFKLNISTDIPIGSGLGSSAAFAVALSACISEFLGKPFDLTKINEIAYNIEKICHGNPSGGDNSTSCYGGLIWFRKESEDLKIIQPVPFKVEKSISHNFLFIDSGKPQESTGQMVAKVKNLNNKNPKLVEEFLENQEESVRKLLASLKVPNPKEIVNLIKKGEVNLEKIGVVSSYSRKIIKQIEKAGGAAKICGGGGIKKGTGIILVYSPSEKVLRVIKELNLPYFKTQLGTEGIRREKGDE